MMYVYHCEACKSEQDVKMSIAEMEEKPVIFCQKCRNQMKRKITIPNFAIKDPNMVVDQELNKLKKEGVI